MRHTNTESDKKSAKTDPETYKQTLSHTSTVGDRQTTYTQNTKSDMQRHAQHTKTDTETCKQALSHTSTVGERQKTHKNTKSDVKTHRFRDTKTQTQRHTNRRSVTQAITGFI